MIYRDYINSKMIEWSKNPKIIFIGYNISNGSKGYGTFAGIPKEKILEMPTAEALMTGIATGMAMDGWVPVLFFERHDFLLIAADQIINHLCKINEMSYGEFTPKVIIRAVIGDNKPFDPGPQHKGNYSDFFSDHILSYYMEYAEDAYEKAYFCFYPVMIIERRSHFGVER